jgi:hypothetical protein
MKPTVILYSIFLACIFQCIHAGANSSLKNQNGRKYKNNALAIEKRESPVQMFIDTVKESKRHLAAAAAARSVSIFGMFPVGVFKCCCKMPC